MKRKKCRWEKNPGGIWRCITVDTWLLGILTQAAYEYPNGDSIHLVIFYAIFYKKEMNCIIVSLLQISNTYIHVFSIILK